MTHREIRVPKAILSDIGRVIVRLNLARAFAPIAAALESAGKAGAGPKPTPERIWSAIQSFPQWRDWQEGRLTPEQWHQLITAQLKIRVGFADFCAAWNNALDPETILEDKLLAKLGERWQLGLLSNTDPIHVDYLERRFSFIRHFPVRIYSCNLGVSKPNPAIYREALKEFGMPAEYVVYIDDIAEYVSAARRLGMDAIQFESPAQLLKELGARGIQVQ